MPGQNKDKQRFWLIECEPKPKEITDFEANEPGQARALSGLDEEEAIYHWIWADDSEKCYLRIERPSEK